MSSKIESIYDQIMVAVKRWAPQADSFNVLHTNTEICTMVRRANGNYSIHHYTYPLTSTAPRFLYFGDSEVHTTLLEEESVALMERILVAVSPKAPPDNPTITGIMALAAEGLFYHKKILDINAGDVSTDCKYVGENIYAAVVTDQDEPRLAFFDFSTGVEPFLVVGAKSYDPRLEGKDVNYFYPIVDNAVLAFSGFKR